MRYLGLARAWDYDTLKQGGIRAVFENIKPAYQRAANEETAINNLINQNSSQANGVFDANKHHQETLGVDAKEIQKHIQVSYTF